MVTVGVKGLTFGSNTPIAYITDFTDLRLFQRIQYSNTTKCATKKCQCISNH